MCFLLPDASTSRGYECVVCTKTTHIHSVYAQAVRQASVLFIAILFDTVIIHLFDIVRLQHRFPVIS